MGDSPFKRVGHINVRVSDIDKSVQFYTEILGFTYIGKCDMRPSAPNVSAYVRLGDVEVELAGGHDMSLYTASGIINHFGLIVDDIEETRKYLMEKNVEILGDVVKVNNDFYCFFFAGPSGERFEVVQYIQDVANVIKL